MASRSKNLLMITHLHKTAGKTLIANLRMHYKEEHCLALYPSSPDDGESPLWRRDLIVSAVKERPLVRFIYGHSAFYGVHHFMETRMLPYYVIFLRNPLDRVASLYHYHLDRGKFWKDEIARSAWSFREWFRESTMLWRLNGMVRQLIWAERPDVLTRENLTTEDLVTAKRILEKYDYIGTQESFDEDAAYLYGSFGCWRPHHRRVVNPTRSKEKVPEDLSTEIIEKNSLDTEIYHYALQLREQRIKTLKHHFKRQIRKAFLTRRTIGKIDLLENWLLRDNGIKPLQQKGRFSKKKQRKLSVISQGNI